jgi:phenylpropionate dioxygenase-like ring-hydroxylating dioxygenase large terminal subunit
VPSRLPQRLPASRPPPRSSTPPGANRACGKKKAFVCGFHGWTYNLDGKNTYILDKEDWKGVLTRSAPRSTRSRSMPGAAGFHQHGSERRVAARISRARRGFLDPFEFEKMRYKWRQWVIFDCNWKTALEAFMEPYHVAGTHPQLLKYGQYYAYSAAHGLHGVSGFDERDPSLKMKQSSTITPAGWGAARKSTYELQNENLHHGESREHHRDAGQCGEAAGR